MSVLVCVSSITDGLHHNLIFNSPVDHIYNIIFKYQNTDCFAFLTFTRNQTHIGTVNIQQLISSFVSKFFLQRFALTQTKQLIAERCKNSEESIISEIKPRFYTQSILQKSVMYGYTSHSLKQLQDRKENRKY